MTGIAAISNIALLAQYKLLIERGEHNKNRAEIEAEILKRMEYGKRP